MRRDEIVRGLETTAGALLDGAIADGHFDAPRRAGAIRRSVRVERQMAQMAGATDMAAKQPAINHRRSPDAGAQREQDDVLKTVRGPDPHFAQQCRMAVVQNGDRS